MQVKGLFSFKLCLVICFRIVSVLSTSICNFDVKLTQSLLNEGFHRNITYSITLNEDKENERWLHEGCVVGVDQTLPAGVYAYPDELSDLRRVKKINAILKNRVNIELPAEQSSETGVFLMGPVKQSRVHLWVPVHARYHQATAGGGTARNEIDVPILYLHCPDQRLHQCEGITPDVSFLCSGSSKEKCSWKTIPYSVMTDTLIWDVPVGNTDHYYLAAVGTSLVLIVGSLYLLKAIHEYKISVRKKKVH